MEVDFMLDFINEDFDRIDKVLVQQGGDHSRAYWQ